MQGFPAELTSFVGRTDELSQVKNALERTRLLTLTGGGGVGKTRLANRVAQDMRPAFKDGVSFVELAETSNPALIVPAIIDVLGIPSGYMRESIQVLQEHLADRELLIVMDNCEHLSAECGRLASRLIRGAPKLRILATSREPLEVLGEMIWDVPPLSLPTMEDAMTAAGDGAEAQWQSEAVDLFEERAAAVHPGFSLDTRDRALAGQLCRSLDGIPLAIELAAVRVRSLSIEQILARQGALFQVLNQGNRGGPARHRTLWAAIDWSHGLCSRQERALWARLSVFTGGFDLESVEDVCTDGLVPREDAFNHLSGLVGKSIVTRIWSESEPRYRLLESVRAYGAERLAEDGGTSHWQRRHRDHFLRAAEACEAHSFGAGQVQINRRLHADRANLAAALSFCLSTPQEADAGMRMAGALWFYWNASGHLPDGRLWLSRMLAANPEPTPERAKGLWVIGWYAMIQGDNVTAKGFLAESTALATSIRDRQTAALAGQFLGTAEQNEGNLAKALVLLESAWHYHRESGKTDSLSLLCGSQLAFVHCLSGNLEQALAITRETLAVGELHGEQWATSWIQWSEGLALLKKHDYTAARLALQAAATTKVSLQDWLGVSSCAELLAWVAMEGGHPQRVARLLGFSRQLCGSIDSSPLFGAAALTETRKAYEEQAQSLMGETAYAEAFRQGEQLRPENVLGLFGPDDADARSDQDPVLTRREHEVSRLVGDGLTNKEISRRLAISQRTVDGHMDKILSKLGFRSRVEVATWITRAGPG